MASECCLSLTKYFLFVFNLIFFFLGSALLSLGLWILFSETSFLTFGPRFISLSLFSYLLIISGVVTILLGFFGSLGALKEVKCMLAIYFILLTVLLVAQTLGGVLLITQRTAFINSLDTHVEELFKEFGKNNSNVQDFEEALEVLQHEAKCCGWTDTSNWDNNFPCSCFSLVNVTANVTDSTYFSKPCLCTPSFNSSCEMHKTGCKVYVDKFLSDHILIILVVIFALSLVEICGTILSMYLYRQASVDYSFY